MAKGQDSATARGRALIVEDNPLGRVLLSSLLMRRGFEVVEVASAEEGLAYLRESPADLVMLDLRLGGMSGVELCHIIREELDLVDLPVIAYTGSHDLASVAHMRLAGFNDILFKPVDAAALDSVLGEALIWH